MIFTQRFQLQQFELQEKYNNQNKQSEKNKHNKHNQHNKHNKQNRHNQHKILLIIVTFMWVLGGGSLAYGAFGLGQLEGQIEGDKERQKYIKKLLRTQNPRQILRNQKKRQKARLLRKKCQWQLIKKQIPWSCYESLHFSFKSSHRLTQKKAVKSRAKRGAETGLEPETRLEPETGLLIQSLNNHCRQVLRKKERLSDLLDVPDTHAKNSSKFQPKFHRWSKECQKMIKEKKQELIYKKYGKYKGEIY